MWIERERGKMVRQVPDFFVRAAIVVFFAGLAASASFISGDALQSYGSTGRSLLQAKKSCPINFEFMNYTIITSKCKGPQYKADLCCPAFKEFACPYADELNDQTNDCASTMFSYINLYGKYPPGLFAYECREGKEGLDCMAVSSKSDNSTSTSSARMNRGLFPVLAVAPVFLAAALL